MLTGPHHSGRFARWSRIAYPTTHQMMKSLATMTVTTLRLISSYRRLQLFFLVGVCRRYLSTARTAPTSTRPAILRNVTHARWLNWISPAAKPESATIPVARTIEMVPVKCRPRLSSGKPRHHPSPRLFERLGSSEPSIFESTSPGHLPASFPASLARAKIPWRSRRPTPRQAGTSTSGQRKSRRSRGLPNVLQRRACRAPRQTPFPCSS
jgi:hypothetical protein